VASSWWRPGGARRRQRSCRIGARRASAASVLCPHSRLLVPLQRFEAGPARIVPPIDASEVVEASPVQPCTPDLASSHDNPGDEERDHGHGGQGQDSHALILAPINGRPARPPVDTARDGAAGGTRLTERGTAARCRANRQAAETPFPSPVTVIRNADGRCYASFVVEVADTRWRRSPPGLTPCAGGGGVVPTRAIRPGTVDPARVRPYPARPHTALMPVILSSTCGICR